MTIRYYLNDTTPRTRSASSRPARSTSTFFNGLDGFQTPGDGTRNPATTQPRRPQAVLHALARPRPAARRRPSTLQPRPAVAAEPDDRDRRRRLQPRRHARADDRRSASSARRWPSARTPRRRPAHAARPAGQQGASGISVDLIGVLGSFDLGVDAFGLLSGNVRFERLRQVRLQRGRVRGARPGRRRHHRQRPERHLRPGGRAGPGAAAPQRGHGRLPALRRHRPHQAARRHARPGRARHRLLDRRGAAEATAARRPRATRTRSELDLAARPRSRSTASSSSTTCGSASRTSHRLRHRTRLQRLDLLRLRRREVLPGQADLGRRSPTARRPTTATPTARPTTRRSGSS